MQEYEGNMTEYVENMKVYAKNMKKYVNILDLALPISTWALGLGKIPSTAFI